MYYIMESKIINLILLMIILFLLCCLYLLNSCREDFSSTDNILENNTSNSFENKKPYLWQYWDTIEGKVMPDYIKLCMKTVDKHCSDSFEIVRLNKDNIFKYIPEIEKYKDKMNDLIIAHKVDIYRIMLLHKYGGVYMDADLICLRDPIEIIHKLDKYDFVGFGCTGGICSYGYGQPSNWILASRPNSILMKNVLNHLLNKIEKQNKFDYHDLGKMVIWEELSKLIEKEKYVYFHYPNKVDGSRDINGEWVSSNIVFSNQKVKYEDEENMMFFVFYSSNMEDNVKKMSENELLSKDWLFTKFLKKALGDYKEDNNITIGYLSWKRPEVFIQTLESHKQNGLFDIIPPENRLIFFQEITDQDKEIAKKYDCNYIGNKNNIGILNAFIELVEACKTPYFIFSENDWNLIEDKDTTKKIIDDCINLLKNNKADIIRLRHRKYPGHPLNSQPKNMDEWVKSDISVFPFKLESLSWLQNPNNSYGDLFEEYDGNYKWYITSLEHQKWSNNIFIGKTDYIKNNIIEFIKKFKTSNDKYSGLEDVLINNLGKDNKLYNMRLAGGEGLFTHKDKL